MAITLSNSPIREVVIGVLLNLTEEQLNSVVNDEDIKAIFPKKQAVPGVVFDKANNVFVQTPEYAFSTENDKQTMFLGKTRITLSSRDKYNGFDAFSGSFLKIFNKIAGINGSITSGVDIGLRYINEMILTPAELKLFKISLNYQNDNVDNYRAGFRINKEIGFVNINIQKDTLPDSNSRVIFDIDAHTKYTNIEENMSILRELAEDVFFNNVEPELIQKWK